VPHQGLLQLQGLAPLQGLVQRHPERRVKGKPVKIMKIMNLRIPLFLLSLAGICATCLAFQTGHTRDVATTSPSKHRDVARSSGLPRRSAVEAGARWVWQNPLPQGNTLYGVSFTNPNTGTATGDNGTIIRTTDGGNSWVIQSSGTTNTLYGVSFADKPAERPMASLPFHSLMPARELLLARME
jgi:hypothetical protein